METVENYVRDNGDNTVSLRLSVFDPFTGSYTPQQLWRYAELLASDPKDRFEISLAHYLTELADKMEGIWITS